MKGLIVAAVAALGLAGCVAVPYGGDPYYYGAPPVSVGVGVGYYSAPSYHQHWRHRHYRGW